MTRKALCVTVNCVINIKQRKLFQQFYSFSPSISIFISIFKGLSGVTVSVYNGHLINFHEETKCPLEQKECLVAVAVRRNNRRRKTKSPPDTHPNTHTQEEKHFLDKWPLCLSKCPKVASVLLAKESRAVIWVSLNTDFDTKVLIKFRCYLWCSNTRLRSLQLFYLLFSFFGQVSRRTRWESRMLEMILCHILHFHLLPPFLSNSDESVSCFFLGWNELIMEFLPEECARESDISINEDFLFTYCND